MNSLCYRIVFNQHRGALMAVQETASGQGKNSCRGERRGGSACLATLRTVAFFVLAGFGTVTLGADLVAAPGGPTVINAPNGVPVVQIAAPSAQGVSHNTYTQFNVPAGGAILNNSAAITSTQLGGVIDANPALKGATARLILNEVTAANPSVLNGYLEVAGARADVVIANPWGITCRSCGFINTAGATLTTGVPQWRDGKLAGYLVNGGTIRVEGQDLDASQIDSFRLISRAVTLASGVHAKRLDVTLGRNSVDLTSGSTTPLAGTGSQGVALDVAALGGMYAGVITLTSSEAGFAVNSQGKMLASEGTVHLSSAGDITLGGRVEGRRDVSIQSAASLTQTGVVLGGGDVTLDSRGQARLDGSTVAQGNLAISAGSLQGQGTQVAGGREDGSLAGHATLTVSSSGDVVHQGQWRSAGSLSMNAQRLDLSAAAISSAFGDVSLDSRTGINLAGSRTEAQGNVRLVAVGTLDHRKASLGAAELFVQSGGMLNEGGTLASRGEMYIENGQSLNNEGGVIEAGTRVTVDSREVLNRHGRLVALGSTASQLTVDGVLDSQEGQLGSNGDLQITAGRLDTSRGSLWSGGTWSLLGGDWSNRNGRVEAGRIRVTAGSFANQGGVVAQAGAGDAQLSFGGRVDNSAGVMRFNGPVVVQASEWNQQSGHFSTLGDTTFTIAKRLVSTQGSELVSGGKVELTASSIDNQQGVIESGGRLAMSTGQLVNAGGHITSLGTENSRIAVTGELDLRDSGLASRGAVSLSGARLVTSGARLETAGSLSVLTGEWQNVSGQIQTNGLQVSATSLDNRSGWIDSRGPEASLWRLQGRLDNRDGHMRLAGDVTLDAGEWLGHAGALYSGGNVTAHIAGSMVLTGKGAFASAGAINLTTGALDSCTSVMESGSTLHLTAGSLTNQGGRLVSLGSGASRITIQGVLDNQGGVLAGNGDLAVSSLSLANTSGSVQSAAALHVETGQLGNAKGKVAARQLVVTATDLDNREGEIGQVGVGSAQLTLSGALDNRAGRMVFDGNTSLQSRDWLNSGGLYRSLADSTLTLSGALKSNDGGRLASLGALRLTAASLDNANGVIESQQRFEVTASTMSNRAGSVRSWGMGDSQVTVGSGLDNGAGVVSSRGSLALSSASLNNQAGRIESESVATLGVQGDVDNRTGVLQARQLTVQGTALNNQGGLIAQQGEGTLEVRLDGDLDNRGNGRLIGEGATSIRAATLDNRLGRILGASAMSVTTSAVLNETGTLASGGALTVQATTLNNGSGLLQGATLALQAQQVFNHGTLLATGHGNSTLAISSSLANDEGTIHSAGSLRIDALQLSNAAGTLSGQSALAVTAASANGLGSLVSAGDLSLSFGGDVWTLAGDQLSAGHDLSLTTPGSWRNDGKLIAGNSLSLSARDVSNHGTLQAGGRLTLQTGSALFNDGTVSGRQLEVVADRIDNRNLLVGETITLRSERLLNQGRNAAIAAAGDLQLSVGSELSNLDGAWISAEGRLSIGEATRPVAAVLNRQSTLQSGGMMSVFSESLINETDAPTVVRTRQTTPASVKELYTFPRAHHFWFDCGSGGRDMCEGNVPYVGKLSFTHGEYQDSFTRADFTGTVHYQLLGDDVKRHVLTVRVAENGQPASVRELPYFQSDAGAYYYLDGYDPSRHILPTRIGEIRTFTPAQIAFHHGFGNAWRDTGLMFQDRPPDMSDVFAPIAGRDLTFPKAAPGPLSIATTTETDSLVGAAPRANMLSGQGMQLTVGSLSNRYSTIAAQGDLQVSSRLPVENLGQALNLITLHTISQGVNVETEQSAEQIGSVDAVFASRQTLSITAPSIHNQTLNAAQPAAPRAETLTPLPAVSIQGGIVPVVGRPMDPLERQADMTVEGPHLPAAVAHPPVAAQDVKPASGTVKVGDTVAGNFTLPTGGLFTVSKAPGQHYLVETDARFTSYVKFISSDYMLQRLGHDPARLEKRLGDGYYEQQRVTQAITDLTGQRFLAGYSDAMSQYQSLMNNGVEYAKQFQLTPGVALSAAQMQQLTRDMVWLEERVVQGEKVLAPVVYLAGNPDAASGQGAVMAGQRVALRADGDLVNSGTLLGIDVVAQARDIALQSGRIKATGAAALEASGSVSLSGSATEAGRGASLEVGSLWVSAGRDLTVSGSSVTTTGGQDWRAGGSLALNRATLNAQGGVTARSGGDMSLFVSTLTSQGDAALSAAGSLSLGSQQWSRSYQDRQSAGNSSRRFASSESWTEGSQIGVAGNLFVATGKDLNVNASSLRAGKGLQATVGGDLRVVSTVDTRTERLDVDEGSKSWGHAARTDYLNLASVSGAKVDLTVAGEAALTGAALSGTQGGLTLVAGKSVTLDALAMNSSRFDYQKNGSYQRSSDTRQQGSVLNGKEALTVAANVDIETHAAELRSDGQAIVQAGRDIRLDTALEQHSDERKTTGKKRGTFSSTAITDIVANQSTTEAGTTVSAESVAIAGQRDVTLRAAKVAGSNEVAVLAGNQLTIQAGTDRSRVYQFHRETTSGMFGNGGIGVTIGSKELTQTLDGKGTTQSQSRSLVGSVKGDLTLKAGEALMIQGSDVTAGRDIKVGAKSLTLDPGKDWLETIQTQTMSSSGVTVQLTSPVISAVQSAWQMSETLKKPMDDRTKLLAAATASMAGYNGYQAYQQAMAGQNSGSGGGVKLSITVGGSHSESVSKTTSTTLAGSLLKAGGNLSLDASGGGSDSSISGTAAQLVAGADARLSADNAILLQSGQNTSEQQTRNHSSSGGVGVAIAFQNNKPAFGFTANGSLSRGSSDGKDSQQVMSTVEAGQTLSFTSGGDTSLKGAEASGHTVVAKVGGDLTLQSRQDTSTYHSKNDSVSADVTVGYGFSGSASLSMQRMDSDYASVNRQTGIKAGDGGFNIAVKGNTDLAGAVIASNQQAIDAGRNQLSTGSLSSSDIRNHSDFTAVSINISAAGGGAGSGPAGGSMMNAGGPASGGGGAAFADHHASSTTTSGISAGTLTVRDGQVPATLDRSLTTATDTTHRLTNDFDKEKVQNALDVTQAFQQQLTTLTANQIAKEKTAQHTLEQAQANQRDAEASGDAERLSDANRQLSEAESAYQSAKQTSKDWAPGGKYGQAAAILGAGLSGNVTGGVDSLLQNSAVAYLQGLAAGEVKAMSQALEQSGLSHEQAEQVRGALHAITACGGAAASGQSCGAGALGGASAVVINNLLGGDPATMTAEEKHNRENLVSGLVAGIAVASGQSQGAATAVNAAQLEMENNYLTILEASAYVAMMKKCIKDGCSDNDKNRIREMAGAQSMSNDNAMSGACKKSPDSAECKNHVRLSMDYGANKEAWKYLPDDGKRSVRHSLNYLYNSEWAKDKFVKYLSDIDSRAAFFGSMDNYLRSEKIPIRWFSGAEFVSRAVGTGLGADGNASYVSFALGGGFALLQGGHVYQWRDAAGNALMAAGFERFKDVFNKGTNDAKAWDVRQLKSEQITLQPIHERYLKDSTLFVKLSNWATDSEKNIFKGFLDEKQTQQGGVDLLNLGSRIKFGCKMLGYSTKDCRP